MTPAPNRQLLRCCRVLLNPQQPEVQRVLLKQQVLNDTLQPTNAANANKLLAWQRQKPGIPKHIISTSILPLQRDECLHNNSMRGKRRFQGRGGTGQDPSQRMLTYWMHDRNNANRFLINTNCALPCCTCRLCQLCLCREILPQYSHRPRNWHPPDASHSLLHLVFYSPATLNYSSYRCFRAAGL